jgi:hypothetical protein
MVAVMVRYMELAGFTIIVTLNLKLKQTRMNRDLNLMKTAMGSCRTWKLPLQM